MWERVLCACRTESVWDGEERATGTAPDGAPVAVGRAEGWQPEQLLALAAETSTMMTFLELAGRAGLPVLGYVSSTRAAHGDGDPDGVALVLAPCIIVAGADRIALAARLLDEAVTSSPVVRSLRLRPGVEAEILAESPAASL